MSAIATTEAALTRPMGPLPLWGWAGVAGLSFVAYRVIKSHGAATGQAPIVSTGATGATGSGADSGGGSGGGASSIGPSGSGVYTPSQGQSVVPAVTAQDLLGGSALDFIKGLGPNFSSFSFGAGSTSLGVANSAQNLVDAQNHQNDLIAQTQQNKDFLANTLNQWQLYYAGLYGVTSAGPGNYTPGGQTIFTQNPSWPPQGWGAGHAGAAARI